LKPSHPASVGAKSSQLAVIDFNNYNPSLLNEKKYQVADGLQRSKFSEV